MIVCLDAGNSRLKWAALADDPGPLAPESAFPWAAQGVLDYAAVDPLAAWVAELDPQRILLANVAGAARQATILEALAPWAGRLTVMTSTAAAAGVVNGYENPHQLGVDRWHALLAARARYAGPCVVVMAGTATTIDSLSPDGRFLGGLIVPGLQLMAHSLARDTANLPLARGQYVDFPGNTDDAIASGCLDATLGAIDRAVDRLRAAFVNTSTTDAVGCLLSGGAAEALQKRLQRPSLLIDNLVLEGLARQAFTPQSTDI